MWEIMASGSSCLGYEDLAVMGFIEYTNVL